MKKTKHTFFSSFSRAFMPKTSISLLLFFLLLGNTSNTMGVTWDGGGTDNNWTTPENWDTNAVPTATDDAVIEGAGFDVVIPSCFHATIQNLVLKTSVSLTIAADAELTIANAPKNGILVVFSSVLTNNGRINANNNIGTRPIFINTGSIFHNNGVANFDDTGHDNAAVGDGMIVIGTSVVNNSGHINIGPNLTEHGIRMQSDATINNLVGGQINILGAGAGKAGVVDGGNNQTLDNEGTICINDAMVDGNNIDPGIAQTGSGTLNTSGCVATDSGLAPCSPEVPTLSQWA